MVTCDDGGDRALDLARGEADVALRFVAPAQRDLVAKKLGRIDGAMYAAQSYLARRGAPSPVENLAGHQVVAGRPPSG